MKKMNRYFSGIITIFMLVGMLTTNTQADIKESDDSQLTAVEVEGTPRLDELKTKPNESQVETIYGDDEIVTAIVEMEDAPVMDYYEVSNYSLLDGETSAGEAVSNFLSSEDAKIASDEIIDSQQNVISKISTLANESSNIARVSEGEFEVIDNWSTIVNAMAIRVPYGIIDKISGIEGVKRAYVEHTYDLPDLIENSVVQDGKENYSYSYDMIGVDETWRQGDTGKGMLVAVLDSGLDIKIDWNGEVVRTHEAFTDDSFMSGNPTDGIDDWNLRFTGNSLEEFLKGNQLNSTTGNNGNHITYDNNALYKNLKVPYACDYAEGDLNVLPADSDHGTHVTGTIAGFASTEEGEVKFSGVAPDAQVLFMKVFPDAGGGAAESYIVNALEDSLKLGADMINLSLGSDNGFANDDTIQNDVHERVNKSGIVLMTSAGNSEKSSEGNSYNGNSLTSNPDESMMSSPAIYSSNISIASIDNTIKVQSYFTWNDNEGNEHKVSFNDPWSVAMKADFSDKEYPIYSVGGVGTYNDYYNAGFNNGYNNGKTGLALVKRGEISFADKVNNAISFSGVNSSNESYGVLGVIVYDNDPNGTELIGMSVSGTSLDSAFISGQDGYEIVNALESGYDVKIKVSKVDETLDNPSSGQMSSFTSWGAGPGLELKPEITAPGGNIWSTVLDKVNTSNNGYTGSYEMMSGTSMAAPHMAGVGSLVRQHIAKESAFAGTPVASIGDIVSQLLISTAIPQKDKNGSYYSPRQQGAGLVNASAAVSTPAYITVDDKKVGKLELGDDPDKNGSYNISFNLNNISDSDLKYNVEVVLMRPDTESTSSKWGERNVISNNDVIIKTTSLGEVSVPAGGNTTFSNTVSLTDSEKSELDRLFENGTYVEGYVILTDATDSENPQIGMPMLSFYGDWSKAPIFDSALWIDEPEDGENVLNNESTWNTNIVGSNQKNDIYGVIGFFNLGQNVFDEMSSSSQVIYKEENITLSPNGDEYFDRIDDYILYQLRDARVVVIEAKDSETGEVYMRDWASYPTKSLYNSSLGAAIPFSLYGTFPEWGGTDMEGNVLPSGTKCTYTITAYGDGDYGDEVYNEEVDRYVTNFDSIIPGENEPTFNGHTMDMTGDVISFPVTIDTVAPKLENNAVRIYEKDGRTYITGKVYDEDGSIASVEIAPYVTRTYKEGYGDPNYSQIGIDRNNPFYVNNVYEAEKKELTFTVDVTEYSHANESYPGENNYYDYKWNGNVLVSCGDYGANDRSYAIKIDASSGIVLSQTSALLNPGQQFDLSVNNNTEVLADTLTRTSSNPEVATIDEYGRVTAIAPGQAVITVSNGSSSATCVVAVEEKNTEVKSFDLSIDSFSGLKPDGELVVKVNNIQPANVKIDNIRWEVSEDEDYANDYASGLITVGKYSSDALSGFLYLTVNSSQEVLPKGHGVLTVTIGDVQRSMDIDWDQIYQSNKEDDIISGGNYNSQSIYVTQGETATLMAKYRQSSLHQIGDVNTELKGLKLDGADFFSIGGSYKAKLVNDEGYALPSDVHIYIVYSNGYKYEIKNYPGYNAYTYDSNTGEIIINYAPSGADNKLLIVADGVESEGAKAGTISDTTYVKPDGMFGPFDWTLTKGNGEIELGEANVNGKKYEAAMYTPSEPGVSYITATTKDGQYSVNFAVISEPVLADKITLDTHNIEMKVGETANPVAILSPTPTNEKDKELTWTSFNPEVATVSEDGTITGLSEGYAYIKVESATDNNVKSYCIVKVSKDTEKYTVTFKDYDGSILKEEIVQKGNSAIAPSDPQREGYSFTGWDNSFENVTEDMTVTAQYSINSYTITFTADGKVIGTVTKNYGESLTDNEYPEIPLKKGYTGYWNKVTDYIKNDITIETVYTADSGDTGTDNPGSGGSGTDNPGPGDTGTDNPGSGGSGVDNPEPGDSGTNNSGSSDSGSNGSSSYDKIPNTGGRDWKIALWIAVILCSIGAVMRRNRRQVE
ncbi:S8 family serine peptidase [Clostridium nigeriense]|uniref:S8 family serine peptidase n=1 Tax=Clostridium nigeriense TaxID=1805470 RepID=UPI003D3437D6